VRANVLRDIRLAWRLRALGRSQQTVLRSGSSSSWGGWLGKYLGSDESERTRGVGGASSESPSWRMREQRLQSCGRGRWRISMSDGEAVGDLAAAFGFISVLYGFVSF
jgi:hypothetical protein